MMLERGIQGAPSTICRWVQRYIPEVEKRWDRFSCPVSSSWRVDETFVNIKGNWHYLYRGVDKQGRTTDFYLSQTRASQLLKPSSAGRLPRSAAMAHTKSPSMGIGQVIVRLDKHTRRRYSTR